MLRCDNGTRSQVIDVNGWSFVKGNESYYGACPVFSSSCVTASHRIRVLFACALLCSALTPLHSKNPTSMPSSYNSSSSPYNLPSWLADKAAEILSTLCGRVSASPDRSLVAAESPLPESSTWLLKANVTVFRHADRTPKQKLKFNFPIGEIWTQPFVRLLNGEREEIILREQEQLRWIAGAVEEAKSLGADGEDLTKLTLLNTALFSKIELPGTKAQLKPVYSKKQAGQERKLTKLTLVFKWGGEFTHSARYQSRDLGENMKKDISIMSEFPFPIWQDITRSFTGLTNVCRACDLVG